MRYKYRQIEHIIQSHRRIVNNAYARPREKNIKATRYAWRFCNGAPKRFVASNASVIAIVALCANRVSNRYRIRLGASEKCREHHGILNGAPKRIRTANRQNRNLMRYPVAPWVHICILSFFAVFVERKRTIGVFSTRISG